MTRLYSGHEDGELRAGRDVRSIPAETSGLDEASVANVTQLATVDRRVLAARVGALPTWLMGHVDDGLRRALAL